ncbi:hypothetical protein BD410DRAFT_846956 [Rickenella mellea]|uniref:F-box domain-containing protein n=1 Tax=Rickenella mellea TaxID=50990 RepID=A0A4Y7PDT0_9AGAM|nr:hypothetical protein BD410DRAFT_846956 [Rickenella mellea]
MQVMHLEGVGVDWENCDLGVLRGLKSLTFKARDFHPRFGFENCLAILDSCPLLEDLHLKLNPRICLKGLDHPVTLPHLRRLTLHTDVVKSDFLLDRLDLPPNVECFLHFPCHNFEGKFHFRWPRQISLASRCHLLQCTIVPDRVEISASVQTSLFSSALTRFGVHVGSYEDLEGRSDWWESDMEAEDMVRDTFRTMNDIIHNSFLMTTPILAISVMDGREKVDLTHSWSQLFAKLSGVQIMVVDLTHDATASFINALRISPIATSPTRLLLPILTQLYIKSGLGEDNNLKLSETIQFRRSCGLPSIDVKYDAPLPIAAKGRVVFSRR